MQPENVEYFSSLSSLITNGARWARKMKSRIVMAKTALKNKKTLFTNKMDLNIRNKLEQRYFRA
jgi:hypothetical protein